MTMACALSPAERSDAARFKLEPLAGQASPAQQGHEEKKTSLMRQEKKRVARPTTDAVEVSSDGRVVTADAAGDVQEEVKGNETESAKVLDRQESDKQVVKVKETETAGGLDRQESEEEDLHELEDSDSEDSGTPNATNGVDKWLEGLTAAQAETEQQELYRANLEKLIGFLRTRNIGDQAKEKQLLVDLLANKTGGNVMQQVVEVLDMIPEPIPDKILEQGLMPTEDEIVHIERMLLANAANASSIVDQETVATEEDPDATANASAGSLEQHNETDSSERALLNRRESAFGHTRNTLNWPKNNGKVTIKYCKSTGLTDKAWDEFKKATSSLTEHCEDLEFIDSTSDCIMKVTGSESGCWAYRGYNTNSQYNQVNLNHKGWWDALFSGTCATKGIAEHEILHALNINHEQTRKDRGSHVNYYSQNVNTGKEHNFQMDNSESTKQGYDIGSIMHYGCKSFAKDGWSDTLRATGRRRWKLALRMDCYDMGQRGGLSKHDVRQLQDMYSCTGRRRRADSRRRRWWR
eukprot:TRINITY_DN7279_c0_g2_i1.p1 TRINITY_DN7279_c0_g2~~TRINITY_DN7279_c0_g2_i1.p1  ORF type:complete len:563 (+),score=116.21 TRINITY_DN7279_c0_g2_i1:122-1690(+)